MIYTFVREWDDDGLIDILPPRILKKNMTKGDVKSIVTNATQLLFLPISDMINLPAAFCL